MAEVCVCEEGFTVTGDELCITPGLQDLRDIVVHTAPGAATFVKATYPWLARIKVRVQGAGGGGGGATFCAADEVAAGSGGAAGGYSESVIEVDDLSTTEQIYVGTGGAGGVEGAAGAAGEVSFFGSHAIAEGGAGGGGGGSSSGALLDGEVAFGGAGKVGEVRLYGGDGEPGYGRGDLSLRKGGSSGTSPFGGGRAGRGSNGDGLNGRIASGEGGSGAATAPSGTFHDGGDGANGRVVIYLYG